MNESSITMAISFLALAAFSSTVAAASATQPVSAFFPPQVIEHVRTNASASQWGREISKQVLAQAEPWKRMSDELEQAQVG